MTATPTSKKLRINHPNHAGLGGRPSESVSSVIKPSGRVPLGVNRLVFFGLAISNEDRGRNDRSLITNMSTTGTSLPAKGLFAQLLGSTVTKLLPGSTLELGPASPVPTTRITSDPNRRFVPGEGSISSTCPINGSPIPSCLSTRFTS